MADGPAVTERFAFDLAAAGADGAAVGGADEAGRGCLAGPIAAAAVCLDYAALDEAGREALSGLDDSKRLTRPRREALYDEVLRLARQVVVVLFSPAHHRPRRPAPLQPARLWRGRSSGSTPVPDVTLVDGFRLPRVRPRAPGRRRRRPPLGRHRRRLDRRQGHSRQASCAACTRATRSTGSTATSATRPRSHQAAICEHGRLRAASPLVRQRRLPAARARPGGRDATARRPSGSPAVGNRQRHPRTPFGTL